VKEGAKREIGCRYLLLIRPLCICVYLQEIESILFAITSIAEGISVEENVHLPVIFTLLTRIPCNNYSVVNQALYLVGEDDILYIAQMFCYCC